MNISTRKKLLYAFTINLVCSIPYTLAQTKENITAPAPQLAQEQEEINQAIVRGLDTLYKETVNLYQGTDLLLEQLAQMIDKNVIKSGNKQTVIKQIRELRALIETVRNDTQFNVEPENLYILLALHKAILVHIDSAVQQKFSSVQPFNLKAFLSTRGVPVDLSLQTLHDDLVENSTLLQSVGVKATTIGLTWSNRFFRRLADLDYKYKVFSVGGKLVATSALWGLYLGYTNNMFTEGIMGKLFGPAPTNVNHNLHFVKPVTNSSGTVELVAAKPGLLGWWHKFTSEKIMNLDPAGVALSALTSYLWFPELMAVKEFSEKSLALLWGRLQGGIEQISAEKEHIIVPTHNFDDVVGLDHAKEVLMEIVRYIEDPERYDMLGMTPEKGFLLCGPSRTGKSFIAQALAGELQRMIEQNGRDKDDIRFYHIEAQLILNKGIKYILQLAENTAPCVLFIDEIDLLDLQRAGGNKTLLCEFLEGLSGFNKHNPRKKVIVVAATNKPENTDEALRKPGRFGKIIHFNYPTQAERKVFLVKQLESLAINIQNFDIDALVNTTENCSFEDLSRMLSSALKKAKYAAKPLTQDMLLAAFYDEILNIVNKENKNIPELEIDILTAQIAGRALTHTLLASNTKLNCATIKPIGKHIEEQTVFERLNKKEKEEDSTLTQTAIKYGGLFTSHIDDTIKLSSHAERIKECKVLLAGNVAEKILLGSCGYSYQPEDRQHALDIIKKAVLGGLRLNELPKKIKEEYMAKCILMLEQYEAELMQLLTENKELLNEVARTLKKHHTITAEHINKIIAGATGSPKPTAATPA